jgi:PAS domain S-box-containing protein
VELELSHLIDSLPDLVWAAQPDGRAELFNSRWCEYTGLALHEASGRDWQSAIHGEDRPRLLERWRSSLQSGQPSEVQVRLRRCDGAYRWFQFRASPLRDASGSILKWLACSTDIEDAKRAREALTASERDLRSIVDTIPTTAWTARPDGSCDFLNQRWLDYAGMTVEQALDWGWAEVIHPADRDRIFTQWQSHLAAGTPVETEARMRRHDGVYRWFLFRANPLRDDDGNICRWYGTNIDIEDRKRGEDALRARELSWRQIVDNIPGLVATMGATGEVEFLNRQTLEYFGKTNEELRRWSLVAAVHPDDLPQIIEARERSIETGQLYEVEHRCRRADGVYRWFQVRGMPVRTAEGTIAAWYLLLIDIEDRKQAEAALQSKERNLDLTLNMIPTFIHVLRADGSVLYANRTVLDFHGTTLDEVRNDYRIRFFHPEDVSRLQEVRREALSSSSAFELEQRVRDKHGTYRHFLIRYSPLLDEHGKVERWYTAAFDIEDRKQAQEQVEQARTELAHVSRVTTLGALTASIAHEVNQPLAGIITNAATCLRMLNANPPNIEGALATTQRTLRDGNRASEVIKRLRTLYSHKEPKYEPVDLNDAAREVLALSMNELQRGQVTLRTQFDEQLPVVKADRVQLQQVLLNLVLNANDAMREVDDRARDLLIATAREAPNHVRISVRDSGVGIDPQRLEKVFEAFYTTKANGMGIGLSVSRSIIQSHHGRLWASAHDGPGATFSFCIPCDSCADGVSLA